MAWIDVEVDEDGKVVQRREVEENKGEPRLVDVDHALALVEELQQCSGVKHPHKNRSYAMALIDVKA